MSNKSLPKEFKFKADDNQIHTVKFILFLISQGFEVACDETEEFITKYVLSQKWESFAVEDNKIVLHETGKDFDNDSAQEVYISDFNLDSDIPFNVSNLIDNKDIVDRTIKALSQIEPSKLSTNELNNIDIFRLKLNGMKS